MTTASMNEIQAAIDSSSFRRSHWLIVITCFLIYTIDGFDMLALGFAAPRLIKEAGIPASSIGMIFGVTVVGTILGQLVVSVLSQRLSQKTLLTICLLWFSGGAVATALASTANQLLIVRMLAAVGLGAAMPLLPALIGTLLPRSVRGRCIAISRSGFAVGGFIAGIASAHMIPAYGWPSVFWLGALLPLLLIPLVIVTIPEPIGHLVRRGASLDAIQRAVDRAKLGLKLETKPVFAETRKPRTPILDVFSAGRATMTVILCATGSVGSLLTYSMVNWGATLMETAGATPYAAATSISAFQSGAVVGSFLLGYLMDKWDPVPVAIVGFPIASVFVALLGYLIGTDSLILTTAFLSGAFGGGSLLAIAVFMATRYPPHLQVAANAIETIFARTGNFIGAVVIGELIAMALPGRTLFLIVATFPALTMLCFIALGIAETRVQGRSPGHTAKHGSGDSAMNETSGAPILVAQIEIAEARQLDLRSRAIDKSELP